VADVLLIDDDQAILRMLTRRLGTEHTVTATNARDAVNRIATGQRFDTIFCDMNMPEMTGLEVLEAVARIDLEQARRIVFMTAGVRGPKDAARLATLPNRCLTKPFNVGELRRIIDGFLPIRMLPR
jgi:CheY-like chemotaxis protein